MESVSPRRDLKAFFLVGSTATGKTSVSQWIAEHYSYDILSADAMMVYRGMDIGTAKPNQTFRSKVCYWGLDLVSAQDRFSVGMYREHALAAIGEVISAGRRIVVTGGTGLYIKSLTHGLSWLSAGNPDIREKADQLLQKGGLDALQAWVKKQAPALYESITDKQNPRRLVRAIETAHCSAGNQNDLWRLLGKGPKIAGLMMPRNLLNERIKLRVKEMYSEGLLDETERLLRQGISAGGGLPELPGRHEPLAELGQAGSGTGGQGPAGLPGRSSPSRLGGAFGEAWVAKPRLRLGAPAKPGGGEISPTAGKAIGYAEAIGCLRGKFTLDEAMELTAKRTRQLAKRQMTWFRNQANVEWLTIDSSMTTEQIARMVLNCWQKIGPTPIAE